jgi:hypothetical protein
MKHTDHHLNNLSPPETSLEPPVEVQRGRVLPFLSWDGAAGEVYKLLLDGYVFGRRRVNAISLTGV